jgi:sugar O-acyltransferase (sialic acid O-acetyltransferase NeuD family)
MARVVIFGTNEMAMISHFYFTHDSPHEVVAFTVNAAFITSKQFCGLPVVPFEELENHYPPDQNSIFIAMFFGRVNKSRAEKYNEARSRGYSFVSYVSSKATVWPDLIIGENCLVIEGSVLNPFVRIANDVVIAGGVIGHHCVVSDHCFICANAVLLGGVSVGDFSFIGANSVIKQGVRIGNESIVGAGAFINNDTNDGSVYVTKPAEMLKMSSADFSPLLTWSPPQRRT